MAKPYSVDGYAGCVERRKRSNGVVVSVLNAEQADLCTEGGCNWYTYCDEHGILIGHRTLRLAEAHAVVPEEWCAGCMKKEKQT